MKKTMICLLLMFVMAGCSDNVNQKAISDLTKNQTNEVTIVVFTNQLLENSFTREIQKNVDYINNNLRPDKPITNVSFIDIGNDKSYNYKNIFNLEDLPQIVLFENKELVLKSDNPEDLVIHYEK
ncbi:hypothetical protein ACH6EH_19845 [Paenibacillus sp. JSM ZJ436]|uniref:hypothetical protein n=1 Tax=Paenibacillus sp. JSM ZJ436 TaxID=3376190 RepID=UPI00379C784A